MKNKAAQDLAKLRAKSLTAQEREDIARKAGKASVNAISHSELMARVRKAAAASVKARAKRKLWKDGV